MASEGLEGVVLAARRLSKTIGRTRLTDDVSFEVRRGDIYALVGDDEAGKSTVARMIVGLVRPTTGEAEVLGTVIGPGTFAVFERVAYASDRPSFRGGLSVRQNLLAITALRGAEDPDAVERALERVGLEDTGEQRASTLGDDDRRLLSVARAIVSSPEVLVLDEPTRGLARVERRRITELLRELAVERQVTILVCAHAADGLTDIATRVGVLYHGRLVGEFTRAELRERGRAHIEIVVSDTARTARVLEEGLGWTEFAVCQESLVRVYVPGERAGELNAALQADGIAVSRLAVNEGSLEDLLERLAAQDGGPS